MTATRERMRRASAIMVIVPIILAVGCASFGEASPTNGAPAVDGGADDAASAEGGVIADASTPDVGSSRYAAAVVADQPLAYFRLDESSGSVTVSSLVGGHMGAVSEGASLGVAGATSDGDTALATDGARPITNGGAVNLGGKFGFENNDPFTLECWIRSDAEDTDGAYRMVLNKEQADAGTQWDVQNIYVHAGQIGFERYVASSDVTLVGPVTRGEFTHVVVAYDGATLRLHLNGALVDKRLDARRATKNVAPFWIAGSADHGPWLGVVDEVAIYDKALSAERVRAHFEAR